MVNKNKVKSYTKILGIGIILLSGYIHIELLNTYHIDKIPLIKDIEFRNSVYYMIINESQGKSYNDIFIAKGSQYYIDIDEKTYNKNRLEDFKNTFLMCKSDKKCIDNFKNQKMVENILTSWTNYYDDFKTNK